MYGVCGKYVGKDKIKCGDRKKRKKIKWRVGLRGLFKIFICKKLFK